jgi:hypothetical protein
MGNLLYVVQNADESKCVEACADSDDCSWFTHIR